MSTPMKTQTKAPSPVRPAFTPARTGLLQRKCACGGSPGVDGECEACRNKRLSLQRQTISAAGSATAPPIVHEVLSSPGQPLDAGTRAFMEPRFGHSFSQLQVLHNDARQYPQGSLAINQPGDAYEQEADQAADTVIGMPVRSYLWKEKREIPPGYDFRQVRIHTDPLAAESARAVNARAYTVGRDLVFGPGQYSPETREGQRLLAHELVHVIQQTGGGVRSQSRESLPIGPVLRTAASGDVLQRTPDEKQSDAPREPRAINFKNITMHFDGADLIVSGDGKEVFRFSAQSGRPVKLSEEDAARCKADPIVDTYMNDARFVGIHDFGPIPEGTYTFSPPAIETFTAGERFKLVMAGIVGKKEVTIGGHSIHAGDWGTGRVALTPQGRLREGPCGNANSRSGFYLHGGILAGSSGCIDIGGDFDQLADFLAGYRRPIVVTVAYEHKPPSVGFFTGLSGAVGYGRFKLGHGPSLRLGAEFAPTGERALASIGYDAVLQWVGGALSAGVRLDIPFNDREAFVRVGLSGGVNFRILRALHGELFAGYNWDLSGPEMQSGLELGAGLKYDFGRVQLEALYNVLRPLASDQRIHQALLGIGFRF